MSSYKKFDTSIIRNRIKDNSYPTLAGANRAIGKTQGLSEEEKSSLKKFAAKHFGAETPAAAPAAKKAGKKTAKKAAAAKAPKTTKKGAKKAAKKGAKRATKAAAAPATEAEPAPVETEAVAAPVRRRGRAPGAAKADVSQQLGLPFEAGATLVGQSVAHNSPAAKAHLMGNVIGSCNQMLSSIVLANNLIPKEVAEEGSKVVAQTMTRAVRVLDQEVVSPLLQADAAAKVQLKTKKTPPPRPKNPPTTVVAEATMEDVLEGADEDSLPLDALSGDEGNEDELNASLTEEERLGVEALRANQTPSLRTPSSTQAPR
jgi:hypothetical protein